MLGNIKSFSLLFRVNADTDGDLEDGEDDEGEDECEGADCYDSSCLGNEATTSEEGDSEGSPDSANSVNRDRSDWIINLDFIEEEDGNNNQGSANHSNEDGHRGFDDVRPGGDTHETSKESIEGHGEIGFLKKDPTEGD